MKTSEYYDDCPNSLEMQNWRLGPAQVLSKAGIPCLIYGEDALCFAHAVPTHSFKYHLVVADENQERASAELIRALGLQIFTGIDDNINEHIVSDPDRTRVFMNSTHLQQIVTNTTEEPLWDLVLVHPQSYFNIDVSDYSRSFFLPPFSDNIRFPTRTAFLDSLYDTYIEPNCGRVTYKGCGILQTWIFYIFEYTLPKTAVLPNGDLEPEYAELKSSLKPENQPIFDMGARGRMKTIGTDKALEMRKEAFRNMGRFDLANRPLPKYPPGNPEFMAKRIAEISAARKRVSTPASSDVTSKRLYSTLAAANLNGSNAFPGRSHSPQSAAGRTIATLVRASRMIRRL